MLLLHQGHKACQVVWSDTEIEAGEDWKKKIFDSLNEARVALLLITANFLSSEFIMEEEIPVILKRRESEELMVYPILAKPCAYKPHKWLAEITMRPKNLSPMPLSSYTGFGA